MAEDKGSVPLRNTTIVYVNVTDANDIVPAFTQASYTTSVREGVTVLPQMLTILQYTDGDSTAEFRRSTFAIRSVQGPNGEPGLNECPLLLLCVYLCLIIKYSELQLVFGLYESH